VEELNRSKENVKSTIYFLSPEELDNRDKHLQELYQEQ